jgi:hypothetical protein
MYVEYSIAFIQIVYNIHFHCFVAVENRKGYEYPTRALLWIVTGSFVFA